MAPVIVSKRGFLALVLWVLKERNGCRVIIRIETGHSNLVSCFGPRIRALARYFTSAFASVKYLSQRPHPRAKTWHKIWWPVLILQTIHGHMWLMCSHFLKCNADVALTDISAVPYQKIKQFSYKQPNLKMSFAEWQPFCFGFNQYRSCWWTVWW